MRVELRITSDGRSIGIASAAAAARLFGGTPVGDLAAEGALVAVDLGQDSSFVGRVVVDEELLPEEEASWLLHLRRPLAVPDGKLLIAGHCDPRSCWQSEHDKQLAWVPRGYVSMRGLDIEPGSYRLDLWVMAAACIAPRLIREALGETPLRWWREQDPRPPMPLWLGCQAFEDWDSQDPDGEALWRRLADEINTGAVAIERPGGAGISYVLQLSRGGDLAGCAEPDDHGWLRTYPFRRRRGEPRRPRDGELRRLSCLPPRIDTPHVERDDVREWRHYGVSLEPEAMVAPESAG